MPAKKYANKQEQLAARRAQFKAWYAIPENRADWIARAAAWNRANPGRIQVLNRRFRLKRLYGMSEEDFDNMLLSHGGGCAICGKTPKTFHVDHDHVTGAVRGLLCANCNRGLGMFQDDDELLIRAGEYLRSR